MILRALQIYQCSVTWAALFCEMPGSKARALILKPSSEKMFLFLLAVFPTCIFLPKQDVFKIFVWLKKHFSKNNANLKSAFTRWFVFSFILFLVITTKRQEKIVFLWYYLWWDRISQYVCSWKSEGQLGEGEGYNKNTVITSLLKWNIGQIVFSGMLCLSQGSLAVIF